MEIRNKFCQKIFTVFVIFFKETGNYELVGVITHKGRTADSGHYVAWV